jgi:hypothetical protein
MPSRYNSQAYTNLSAAHQLQVDDAIQHVIDTGQMYSAMTLAGDGDVYAYKHPAGDGSICWGVNAGVYGFNIARDVYRP